MPCAPSPPSAFCQEKVTTSSFCEIEPLREGRRGRIADGQALAVCRNEIRIGHAHAGGRAVPGEHHVAIEIDLRQVGQLAVVGFEDARILELQLLDHVGHPAGAEALPGKHVDAARAEQRPQRHLDRAGIGSRHDADAVVGWDLQHLARQRDCLLELRLADLCAMRASERGILSAPRPTSRDVSHRDLKRNWDLPDARPALR